MGVRNSLSRAWEREQQVIEQRPGLYKLLMVIAGMQLVSALFNVDSNRWFALLAVVFGVLPRSEGRESHGSVRVALTRCAQTGEVGALAAVRAEMVELWTTSPHGSDSWLR